MMRVPDGPGQIELAMYHAPEAITPTPEPTPSNTLGLHRVMFAVDDLQDTLARLRPHGAELVGEDGEVSRYGDSYLLCYLRGPSGIILALSQELESSRLGCFSPGHAMLTRGSRRAMSSV